MSLDLPIRPDPADAFTGSRALALTLYSRIREELRERIASGAWQPHDRVPSESALMKQYAVSRITVRQALGDLEKERVIFKVPGKGSFVAPSKPFQELGRLQGFAEAMGAMGHDTYNRVLSVRHLPATPEVAERLQIGLGAPVTEIRRVRHLERQPVSLDLTWLPQRLGERVAREDLATRDIFGILETDCASPLGHADLVIDAVLSTPSSSRSSMPGATPSRPTRPACRRCRCRQVSMPPACRWAFSCMGGGARRRRCFARARPCSGRWDATTGSRRCTSGGLDGPGLPTPGRPGAAARKRQCAALSFSSSARRRAP